MKVTIVAVAGKAGSGKDTFFSLATDTLFGLDSIFISTQRFAFGDKVKEVAFKMGWDGAKDENGRTGLQLIGDGARNLFDKQVWIRKTLKDIVDCCTDEEIRTKDSMVVFVTDCRYPNEILSLKALSCAMGWECYSVYISRNIDNGLTEEQKKNSSESSLDEYVNSDFFDIHILNDSDISNYRIKIEKALDGMGVLP